MSKKKQHRIAWFASFLKYKHFGKKTVAMLLVINTNWKTFTPVLFGCSFSKICCSILTCHDCDHVVVHNLFPHCPSIGQSPLGSHELSPPTLYKHLKKNTRTKMYHSLSEAFAYLSPNNSLPFNSYTASSASLWSSNS